MYKVSLFKICHFATVNCMVYFVEWNGVLDIRNVCEEREMILVLHICKTVAC